MSDVRRGKEKRKEEEEEIAVVTRHVPFYIKKIPEESSRVKAFPKVKNIFCRYLDISVAPVPTSMYAT